MTHQSRSGRQLNVRIKRIARTITLDRGGKLHYYTAALGKLRAPLKPLEPLTPLYRGQDCKWGP